MNGGESSLNFCRCQRKLLHYFLVDNCIQCRYHIRNMVIYSVSVHRGAERFAQDCRRANARHARLPPGGDARRNAASGLKTSASITKGTWEFRPLASPCSCPSSGRAVHKRIKEGKLTAFFFYITRVESTFFGTKRKVKLRPYIVLSSERMQSVGGGNETPGGLCGRTGRDALDGAA